MYIHMYVCSLAEDALRVQLGLCCKRLGSSSGLDSVNVTVLSHTKFTRIDFHLLNHQSQISGETGK